MDSQWTPNGLMVGLWLLRMKSFARLPSVRQPPASRTGEPMLNSSSKRSHVGLGTGSGATDAVAASRPIHPQKNKSAADTTNLINQSAKKIRSRPTKGIKGLKI
jgi:hypothetical protein